MEFLAQTRDGESLFPFSLRGELLTLPTEDDSNNYIYEIRSNIPCTSIRISKYQLITSIQRIFSLIYQ